MILFRSLQLERRLQDLLLSGDRGGGGKRKSPSFFVEPLGGGRERAHPSPPDRRRRKRKKETRRWRGRRRVLSRFVANGEKGEKREVHTYFFQHAACERKKGLNSESDFRRGGGGEEKGNVPSTGRKEKKGRGTLWRSPDLRGDWEKKGRGELGGSTGSSEGRNREEGKEKKKKR